MQTQTSEIEVCIGNPASILQLIVLTVYERYVRPLNHSFAAGPTEVISLYSRLQILSVQEPKH